VLRKDDGWVKKCMELRVQADQRGPGEVVREDCQAHKLNKEDAMDRKWRKLTKDV